MSTCSSVSRWCSAYVLEQVFETSIQTVNVTDCMNYITVNILNEEYCVSKQAFEFLSCTPRGFLVDALLDK